MQKVCEIKTVKIVQNPDAARHLRKVMEQAKERLQTADQRRATDIRRVAEIKQRF